MFVNVNIIRQHSTSFLFFILSLQIQDILFVNYNCISQLCNMQRRYQQYFLWTIIILKSPEICDIIILDILFEKNRPF